MEERKYIIKGDIVEILLNQGKTTIINTSDLPLIKGHRWFAHYNKRHDRWYVRTAYRSNGKRITLGIHRLILSAKPGQLVDHINGDGLDNRRENLRICNHAGNSRNQNRTRGASKFKGVIIRKSLNKWNARIRYDGKQHHLGYFDNEIDAALAYDYASIDHHGEFGATNFPRELLLHLKGILSQTPNNQVQAATDEVVRAARNLEHKPGVFYEAADESSKSYTGYVKVKRTGLDALHEALVTLDKAKGKEDGR